MAAPTRFLTLRKKSLPRWLTDEEGELVGYSLDLLKQIFVERVRLGLLARFPSYAPPDALASVGRERRVVRGINESQESFAGRCVAWLDDRDTSGNPFTLMQKLAEYTGPGPSFRTVDNRGNWFSRDESGNRSYLLKRENWDWDNEPSRWSRFWVIIYPNSLWVPQAKYGSGIKYGEPDKVFGATITPAQVATIRSLVADWKPLHGRCVNIILAFDNASFDPSSPEPDGQWGTYFKITGGNYVRSRLQTARYLQGVI